jgi:hypothetical protein
MDPIVSKLGDEGDAAGEPDPFPNCLPPADADLVPTPTTDAPASWVDHVLTTQAAKAIDKALDCVLPELGDAVAEAAEEAGEVEVVYHYEGQEYQHEIEIENASGQNLVDTLRELDRKGAVIDKLTILGHGGSGGTRGNSVTLCGGTLTIQTMRVHGGTIERGRFIVVSDTDDGDTDITDLMNRIAARSPNMKIVLKACYAGESDQKLGKKLADILGVEVEAFTGALRFIPGCYVSLGFLSWGKWVIFPARVPE